MDDRSMSEQYELMVLVTALAESKLEQDKVVEALRRGGHSTVGELADELVREGCFKQQDREEIEQRIRSEYAEATQSQATAIPRTSLGNRLQSVLENLQTGV